VYINNIYLLLYTSYRKHSDGKLWNIRFSSPIYYTLHTAAIPRRSPRQNAIGPDSQYEA
jgi:hypothetical protein